MRHLYMALPLVLLLAVPAYSQTFCNRIGNAIVCDGDNGSSRTYAPLGRTGGVITDERGNVNAYSNGVIIEGESPSYRDAQRRSEERNRELIYGDWGSSRSDRSRSRYDEER